MNEKSWLWAAIIVGGIILGLIWNKQDRQGWVPQQQSQAIEWPNYIQQAKQGNKQLFVYFGRSDCIPCQKMKSEVLSNPTVQQALQKYIVCILDVNQDPNLAQKFGVSAVPAMFIVDGNEKIIKSNNGYLAVDAFTQWLSGQVCRARLSIGGK